MIFEASATTTASSRDAWAALADVEAWPRWTESMTSVVPLDGSGLRIGARYRVGQPKMPALVWQVTEFTDGASFTWATSSPGVRTVGRHRISAGVDGSTTITIGIEQTGPLAGIINLFTGKRTRRYLQLEATGLAAASSVAG